MGMASNKGYSGANDRSTLHEEGSELDARHRGNKGRANLDADKILATAPTRRDLSHDK